MDMSLKAKPVDKAVDTAYGRSGKEAVESAELYSQIKVLNIGKKTRLSILLKALRGA